MKKIHIVNSLLIAALLTISGLSFNNINKVVKTVNATTTLTGPGDYYSSISSSLTGENLKSALVSLNKSKRKKTIGYDGLRNFYAKSDRDWTGNDDGKIVGFYDNSLIGPSWDSGKTWNREHVWPNSRGGGEKGGSSTSPTVDQDAHMPRPTSIKVNSSRGNQAYAESGAYDPASEGIENYRGIAARIIFYCAIADTQLSIVDSTSLSNVTMGKLSDLLKWNLEYLPSTSETAALELRVEQNRNQVIQNDSSGQGNRNPFIDHPEYACKIWGDTNSTTKQICANSTITTLTKLTMNTTSESLMYGQTLQLSVTPTPSDASSDVTWSTSDSTIASVSSSGLVTAQNKEGYVQITAKSTYDTSITATCQIYVTPPSDVDITSISADDVSLGVNEKVTINPTYLPTNAYPIPTYSYISNDISVATVDSNGQITGLKEGNTTINITATQGSITKNTTCNVTVTKEVVSTEDTITIEQISGAYATDKSGTTSLGNDIKYTDVGCYDKTTLQFRKTSGSLWNTSPKTLDKISIDVTKGAFQVYGCTTAGTKGTLISASSDGSYDLSGYQYYYICSSNGAANASKITITYKESGSTSDDLTLSPSELSLKVGETTTLNATSSQTITWTSSNPNVATINDGLVTALSVGTTIIKATSGTKTLSCSVTVTEKEEVKLISVSTSNQTTSFNKNDIFSYDGTLTAKYSDGSSKTVSPTSISSPDMSTIGEKTITLTYEENGISVKTTYVINVKDSSTIVTKENSIKKCYESSAGSLAFNVYGVYVGLVDGAQPIIMNGEYGIELYGTSVDSSWVIGETVLCAKTPTLAIYKNLYELSKASVSIITDETTIDEEITPIVTYSMTGNENTTSNQDLASRYSSLTGVVKTLSLTSYTSGKDISGTVEVNGKTVNIFAKKNTIATSDLFTFLNNSKTNNEEITIEGFTTIFSTTFQLSIVRIVTKDSSYTASDFADDLLSLTNDICNLSKNNNWKDVKSELSTVWLKLEGSDYYLKLNNEQIEILINTVSNEYGTNIEQAMNRYDHIITRYGLKNFITRSVSSSSSTSLLNINNENSLPIVLLITLIGITTIASFVYIRKKQY